jgi:hypothetical protein
MRNKLCCDERRIHPPPHTYVPVTRAHSVHCNDHCRVPQVTVACLVGPSVQQAVTAAAPTRSARAATARRRSAAKSTCSRPTGADRPARGPSAWTRRRARSCGGRSAPSTPALTAASGRHNGRIARQQRRQQRTPPPKGNIEGALRCVVLPRVERTDGFAATVPVPIRRCALTWPSTHDSALRNCSETRIIELSTTSLPTSKHSLHLQHRRIIACNRQIKTHIQDAPYNVDRLCTHRTALLLSADRSMTPCDRTRRSGGGAEAKCAEAQLSVAARPELPRTSAPAPRVRPSSPVQAVPNVHRSGDSTAVPERVKRRWEPIRRAGCMWVLTVTTIAVPRGCSQ